MIRPALAFLALLCVFLLFIWVAQRSLIYFPDPAVPAPDRAGLPRAEEVRFSARDGAELRGWFVPSAAAPPTATVIVFNGNAGNRAYRAPLAEALSERGMSVLLFDYRGYGGSSGRPTEQGLAADARAARTFAAGRPGVDPGRLVYFGESLGAAVAVDLAAEHAPAGLILRSPFTSMADVGSVHYPILPVRWLLRDRYESLGRIARIACPLLVIAGSRDAIVPVEQSRRLHDAARTRKQLLVIDGADHNDAELLIGNLMLESITRFVNELGR